MRINSHVLDAYAQRGIDRTAETKSESAIASRKPASSDTTQAATLSISGEAKRLAAVNPPVDAEKVAEVRQRIEAGEFSIDSTKIAKRILDRLA